MPMLAVSVIWRSLTMNGWCSALMSRSAIRTDSWSSRRSSQISTNSSPPKRAAVSVLRSCPLRRCEIFTSSASPT